MCYTKATKNIYYNNKTDEIDIWYGHVLFMDGTRIALRV